MPLKNYGVLKGKAIGRLRDADDDHYQILLTDGKTQHRIACNVKSSAKNAPSSLLFQSVTNLPTKLTKELAKLKDGHTKLSTKPGGLAQDYVRGGLVDKSKMVEVPPDAPGAKNDLKDILEDAVRDAMDDRKATVYAFGEKWGPEKTKRDKYFHFLPGNGIHDIHMNQGNGKQFAKDNGVWQDGALMFQHSNGTWLAIFLAFQSQTFDTDDKGRPKGSGSAPATKKAAKKAATKKAAKKAAAKKAVTKKTASKKAAVKTATA
jgi:uncharacterized protein YukJ